MTRRVEVIRPDSTLQEAAEKMKDLDVGPLPVCEGDRLVGMITDRDITVRGVAEGQDPWTDHVRDVMTKEVIFCFEDQDVAEAARLMKDKQVRRLVVLDRDRRLVGIVSLGDLAVDADEEVAGNTLEGVSQPAVPNR
jgi:CBS domain-containing protein